MAWTDIIPGLFDAGVNLYSAYNQNKIGQDMVTLEGENLQFQKDQQLYNEELQQTIFNREDDAIQRRAKDLAAAGLHPMLAAGQSARAGSVVPISAPQRGTEGKKARLQAMETLSKMEAGRSVAEIQAIQAQTKKTTAEADYLTKTLPNRVALTEEELKRQLDQNYQLRQTVNSTIQTALANKNKAQMEAQIAEFRRDMTAVDRDNVVIWRNWFNTHYTTYDENGQRQVSKENAQYSPYVAEYVAMKLANDINLHNLKNAQETENPVGQQTDWKKQLGRIIAETLKDWEQSK